MELHGETRNEVYQEVSEEPADINAVARNAKTVNKLFSEMNKLCLHSNVITRVLDRPHQRGAF